MATAKKTTKTNDVTFEKKIWNAACVLWGHIPAADYRKLIVGLIFLRFISYRFDKRYKELVEEGYGFENDKDFYDEKNIFFVPEKARWEYIGNKAHTPEIGQILDEAMKEIEEENASLKGVLPKIFSDPAIDKQVLGEVVDLFSNADFTKELESGRDILGETYQYCIKQFAAYEGKKGGEFYTPQSIVRLLVEVLRPFNNCRVYDPCCGSGGMFVQSVDFVEAHSGLRENVSIFGQESNADTWKMAKINMAIRGIDANFGPHQADTFHNDLHYGEHFDFIMANPPFNLTNWGQEKIIEDKRWKYGTPPAGNANFAWIQHMIHHLEPTGGKIGLVLANGALSVQQNGEGDIRQAIIKDDLVECIVALPSQLFYSVTIPVTLWFITKNKAQPGKTLFIDARQMGYMTDRTHRDLSTEDIQKIANLVKDFQEGKEVDELGFSKVATTEDIANRDYVLTPGLYVGVKEQEEDDEPFEEKMNRLTSTLNELFKESSKLQVEIQENLARLKLD